MNTAGVVSTALYQYVTKAGVGLQLAVRPSVDINAWFTKGLAHATSPLAS